MQNEIDDRGPSESASKEGALPEPVRDHLGQQLRSVFTTGDGVPDYLGDPVVPEEFEPQIKRLEVRLKTHEEGTEAVAQALDQILGDLGGTGTGGSTSRT
ncbi:MULTISPECIES: hypothetical protein [unclassified Methylobacterium]|uniref:hypothetical protein n=1 Tax=unclassified Methylobacterium TaxID=2615210 RepID=UPI000701BE13|nr:MULTISPECIES: hypothetical protein [unclassified Methylobacterium]KQP61527.1 hypothetical protein ASF39_02290 [Methylobacterium sp. Leaf108]KQT80730.1 hypothetical protein ASG59_04725 [Methylobacterium sp. Leaf466]